MRQLPVMSIGAKKLESLKKTVQYYYERNVSTMNLLVPRGSLQDNDSKFLYMGVECKIITKNTCCVRVEIPVQLLYDAIKNL